MVDQIHKDLLHVYDQWRDPNLSEFRLQEMVNLGWIWFNDSKIHEEDVGWEITNAGWQMLEQVKLVGMIYE